MNRSEALGGMATGTAPVAMPAAPALGANGRFLFGRIGAGDRSRQDLKNASARPNVRYIASADVYPDLSAVATPMANLFCRNQERITFEVAVPIKQHYEPENSSESMHPLG